MPAEPESVPVEEDDDERKRVRLTIALLASVAFVQVAGMLSRHLPGLTDIMTNSIVVVPAAGFAVGLSRGLRLRIGIVAFALLWSGLSIWGAFEITRFAEMLAAEPGMMVTRVSPWFARVVAARSVCFTAAAIVLVTGRPTKARRMAGAALGALYLALFVAEHIYQHG